MEAACCIIFVSRRSWIGRNGTITRTQFQAGTIKIVARQINHRHPRFIPFTQQRNKKLVVYTLMETFFMIIHIEQQYPMKPRVVLENIIDGQIWQTMPDIFARIYAQCLPFALVFANAYTHYLTNIRRVRIEFEFYESISVILLSS